MVKNFIKKRKIGELLKETFTGEWGTKISGEKGVKVIRTTNFTHGGKLNLAKVAIRNIPVHIIKRKKLKYGDIILEKSGGSDNFAIGRVVYFDIESEEQYLCNNFTLVLRVDNEIANSKYVFYYLLYLHKVGITKNFQNKTTGIRNLQVKRYLSRNLLLPPIELQKSIVSILEKCESAIQKRKEAIRLTDEFLKSTFLEMFGDPVRNPKRWTLHKIGDLTIETVNGNPGDFSEKKFEYIDISSIDNITKVILQVRKITGKNAPSRARQLVKAGDILVSTVRPNLNAVAVVPDDLSNPIASTGFCVLRVDRQIINKEYLFEITKSNYFIASLVKIARGASYPAVTNDDVKNIELTLPSLAKQKKFTNIVQKVEKLKQKQRESEKQLSNLFNSLMQRSFRGNL